MKGHKKKGKATKPKFWGRMQNHPSSAFATSIPASMRYVLEPLEPRYLLSGAPIVVNQTPNTPTTVTNSAYTTAVKAGINSLVQEVSYLGQQLTTDTTLTQTALPFINQTVNGASQETASLTFGQTLFSDLTSAQLTAFQNSLSTGMGTGAVSGTPSTQYSSTQLATLLQTLLPSNETVTDNSSTNAGVETLDMTFSADVTSSYSQLLSLGNAAEAFGIQLVQISPTSNSPAPDVTVQSTFDVTFDLKVNMSQLETDLKNGAGTTTTNADFHFDPGTISQVLTVNDNGASSNPYLSNFGVQFGIIGAGESPTSTGGTYGINGAYSQNSTLQLNDDITLSFKNSQGNVSSDLTLNDLPSSALTATTSSNYYTINAPTTGTFAAGTYQNQAQLNLNVDIYDDNSSGDTNTNPAYNGISNQNDYIAALGGVTGQFQLTSGGLFSTDPITVNPNNVQLASLARITPMDIVTYAEETGYVGAEVNGTSALTGTLPFLTTTVGDAYDFGDAINNAFVNALSTQTSLLIAASQPFTYTNSTTQNFSSLDGSTTFNLLVSGTFSSTQQNALLSVSLPSASRNQSISTLKSNLQAAIDSAWNTARQSNSNLPVTDPITVALEGDAGSSQLLELISSVQGIQFAAYNFSAPASNILNLGFNVYTTAQLSTGDYNPSSSNFFNYQLTGVAVQTGPINLSKFSGSNPGQLAAPTALEITWVEANGSTLGNSPTYTALLTIPSTAYSGETAFVAAVQTALQNAGLQDGITDNGVQVKGVTDADGTDFDLVFYGGPNVASLTVKDVSTTDFPSFTGASHFSNFGTLTAAGGSAVTAGTGVSVTSTAPAFTLAVTSGGSSPTTTTYTVFVNGNLTNGYLNNQPVNQNATDLASSLVQALTTAGALSSDSTTGITVSAGTDSSNSQSFLAFSAANPGNTSSTIASFKITAQTGLSALNLSLNTTSQNAALSGVNTVPTFQTIQEFAALLATTTYTTATQVNGTTTHSLLASTPSFIPIASGSSGIVSDSFNFPIQIIVDQNSTLSGSNILPTLTGQTFSFASSYTNSNGETISNLASSDTANVNRQDDITFNFGFNLIQPINTAETLTATMPINFILANGTLSNELILQVMLDDGVTHTITVSTATASTNTDINAGGLYGADGKAASVSDPGAGLVGDLQNALNTVLGYYNSTTTPLVTVTLTPSDGTTTPILNFTSAPGSTTELLITVPPYALSSTTISNSAYYILGFGQTGASNTTSTTINNATSGTSTMLTTTLASANKTLSVTRQVLPTNANNNQTSVTDNESVATVVAPYSIGTNIASDITATNPATPNYVLTHDTYFEVSLPDGTQTTLHVDASDTTADTSMQDLITAINLSIAANPSLNGIPYALASQLGEDLSSATRPKIIAYLANANGSVYTGTGSAYLAFQLNPDVYTSSTINQSWNIAVQSVYAEQDPNGAISDLGLSSSAVSDTTQSPMGLVSQSLTASNFTAMAATGQTTAKFDVSINGTPYVTLSVNLSGVTTITGLVANINSAIASQNVTFNFNNNGPSTFPLSDYLRAEVTGSGTQVIIRLLDIGLASDITTTGSTQAAGTGAYPVLTNATIVPVNTNGVQNPLTLATTLAFANTPLLIGLHGSDGTMSDPSFKGTASISYTTAASTAFGAADFGFALFNIGSASLNESIVGTLSTNTATPYLLSTLFVDLENGTPLPDGATFNLALDSNHSYADLTLNNLTFPSSSVQGLSFNSGANIQIGYGTSASGGITSLSVLPSYSLTYVNTNGMQDLASITYDAIGNALLNIGTSLVNYMSNDPAFSTKLFFITQNYLTLDSIGEDFDAAIAASATNKPGSLELAPAALATALGLPTSAVTFLVRQNGTAEQLVIQFAWAEAVTQTLNLAIDIGGLANHTTTPAQVLQYLLDLYSISGSSSDGSLNVNFSAISQLNINLTMTAATNGLVQTPQAVLSNPTSGNFFETQFLLSGQNLQGTLPAGTNSLSLSNGQVALDATGQVAFTDSTYSAPSYTFDSTSATYNAGSGTITATANGAFAITDFAATTSGDSHFHNLIAVTDLTGSAGGLYYISQAGSASTDWVLTRYTPTVTTATAQAVVTQSLAGDATYSTANGGTWTASATGPLTIQGNLIEPTNPQGLSIIDLQNQADPTENGIYYVVQSGSIALTNNGVTTPATPWILERFIPTTFDYNATTTLTPATTNALAVSNAPITGTYNSGTGNFSGTGTLVIDGYTLTSANINGQILLNGQDNLGSGSSIAPNGLYTLTALSGNSWTLHLVHVPVTGTRYYIQHGTQSTGNYYGYLTSLKYAQLLEPATYSYQIGNVSTSTDTSVILPYTVDVATTGTLSANFQSGTISQPATLTGTTNGSINSLHVTVNDSDYGLSGTITQVGIDSVKALTVGSLVLVKDQTAANYENGVYVVTDVGSTTTPWVLTRADFADSASEISTLRVNVLSGTLNAGITFVQNAPNLTHIDSSGNSITFGTAIALIYSNTDLTNWFTFNAQGGGASFLPLGILLQTTTVVGQDGSGNDITTTSGSTTLINRDLIDSNGFQLTATQIQTFANEAGQLNSDPAYLAYPLFQPLQLSIPSLYNYNYNAGQPNPTADSVTVKTLPDLQDSFIPTSILDSFKDGFFLGDALDLALFTIQSAVDEAVAQDFPLVGTNLASYVGFVELFRDEFTTAVRQNLLSNPLEPLNDIRNALWQTVGPSGLNLLVPLGTGDTIPVGQTGPGSSTVTESDIEVLALTGNGVSDTSFNLNDPANTNTYGVTPQGQIYEKVPSGDVTVAFAFTLAENYAPSYNVAINSIDLGNTGLGYTISNSTVAYSNQTEVISGQTSNVSAGSATTGGVLLERKFVLNMGFGMTLPSGGNNGGFFVFNPLENNTSNPFFASNAQPTTQPTIDFGFKAMLTGDINSPVVVPFLQTSFSSTLNQLNIEVADGRLLDYLDAGGTRDSSGSTIGADISVGDGLPSGFYGDVIYDINSHTHVFSEAVNNNLAFTGSSTLPNAYLTLTDFRLADELGPEEASNATAQPGVMSFQINADSDIDLMFQSQSQSLIPAMQADFIYSKRWGTGANLSEFGLNFDSAAILGLGNTSLGSQEESKYYADGGAASTSTVSTDTFFINNGADLSPGWRFDRSQLNATSDGYTFASYQNLKIDALDYLGGTLLNTIHIMDEIIAPFRPFFTFMGTPIPGTNTFIPGGLILANLNSKFANFLAVLNTIDGAISSLNTIAEEDASSSSSSHPWIAPLGEDGTAEFGSNANTLGEQSEQLKLKMTQTSLGSAGNASRLAAYKEANKTEAQKNVEAFSELPFADDETLGGTISTVEEKPVSNSDRIKAMASDLSNVTENPGKFAETFNKFQDGSLLQTESGENLSISQKLKNSLVKQVNDAAKQNDKRGGTFSASVGLTTGAILVEALNASSLLQILQGQNANLLLIQFPGVTVSFTYEKTFPLPAFPPLQLDLAITLTLNINLNFGWDTSGFFFNGNSLTSGSPLSPFGFSVAFKIGVELNFVLVVAEVSITLTIGVNFFWQDINGTGKLHMSDIDYLLDHNDPLVYEEIYGTLTLEFSINIVIPIPLIGPITIPILDLKKTFDLFDVTVNKLPPQPIILGSVDSNGVLLLNSGPYASQRLFDNTSHNDEIFDFYSLGVNANSSENILVEFDNEYFEEFDNVKTVVGYAGNGTEVFDADPTALTVSNIIQLVDGSTSTATSITISKWNSSNNGTVTFSNPSQSFTGLESANVIFLGGNADVTMVAGLNYHTAFGESILEGGTRTSLLDGSASQNSVILIGGGGPSTLYGSSVGGDILAAGTGPDLLYGNGNHDTFYIQPGFVNDRVFATGNSNSIHFNGGSVSIPTIAASYVSSIIIQAVTADTTFQFGPLVESAKSGSSTVFFATDPSTVNQINSWYAGTGANTFNVFAFIPNETLTLYIPNTGGENTYNVYLGNPKANLSPTGSTSDGTNNGYLDIVDPTDKGILNITQTDATPVSYQQGQVLNGREHLNYSTMAEVNIDSGDSSIIWGDPNNPTEYVPITGGTIQTGSIILVGNVELVGNMTLKLDNSFVLNYSIDMIGTLTSPANLEIDLINPLTSDISNFYLTNNAVLSISSGTYSSTNYANYTPNYLGYGTIYLNLPTGGVQNYSGGTGAIELANGLLAINARDAIGASGGNDIKVWAANLAARTTGTASSNSPSGRGIYIFGMNNLSLSAYDTPLGFILGLSTAVGNIEIDMASGKTLTYFQINAGGANGVGGNVTINADYLVASSGFHENVTGVFPENVNFQFPIYTFVEESFAAYLGIPQGSLLYYLLSPFYIMVLETRYITITETILVTETKSVLFGGSSGQYANSISGTGTLTFENVTTPWTIVVGDVPNGQTTPANALLLGSGILDTISDTFQSLIIGRPGTPPAGTIPYVNLTSGYSVPLTGTIDLESDLVFDLAHVTLQAANLNLQGSLHDSYVNGSGIPQSEIDLTAYDPSVPALGTSLVFKSTAVYQATSLYISSAGNLTLNANYISGAYSLSSPTFSNGIVAATSTAGSIELSGQVTVTTGHDSVIDLVANNSLTIDSSVSLVSDALLTLVASTGAINENYVSGTSSRIKSQQIYAKSGGAINLHTDTTQFVTLESGVNVTVNNLDDYTGDNAAVILNDVKSTAGNINFDNNKGDIFLLQDNPSQTVPVISALNGSVTLTTHTDTLNPTRGQIIDTNFSYANPNTIPVNTLDVSAQSLILNAAANINLVGSVANLTATVSATGDTLTFLDIESGTVTSATTQDGIITLVGEDSLSLLNVNSGGANISINNDSVTENSGSVITLGLAAVFGTVNAGTGIVTLASYESILGVTGENLITGSEIHLTSDTGTVNTDAINVAVHSGTANALDLDAQSLGNGNINITTESNVLLDSLHSQNGNITVASATGFANVDFTVKSVAAASGASNVTLNASGTIENQNTNSLVLADYLYVTSGSDTDLNIAVTSLVADITGVGNLTILSTDSLNVEQAITYNGTITLSAGLVGTSGDNLTAGNIYIGIVTAGSGATTGGSTVNLTSFAGLISDITAAADPSYNLVTHPPLLTGSTLNATTFNGIDINTGLHTAISTLNATSNNTGAGMKILQTGDILIHDVELLLGGDFTLTASSGTVAQGIGTINVDTLQGGANTGGTLGASSSITLTSTAGSVVQALNGLSQQIGLTTGYLLSAYAGSGEINLLTNVGNLNAIMTGTSGNITIVQNNALTLGEIYTPSGNFDLTLLVGSLSSSPTVVPVPTAPTSYTPGQYHITANDITITSPGDMGSASQFINVYADQVDLSVTQGGGIFFHNYKIHQNGLFFTADQVTTVNGPISIISAGDFFIYHLVNQTTAGGNDINITSTNAGDILLNFIGTGMDQAIVGQIAPPVDNVTITSDGNILAVDDGTAIYHPVVNIVAYGVNLSSQTGIGNADASQSPIITGRLLSAHAVTGSISAGNSSQYEFFIDGYSTGSGSLGFIMDGGGDLNITGVSTGNGNITLIVKDRATLFLGTAQDTGNVSLTADHMDFYAGPQSVFGTGIINIQPNSPTQFVQISAYFAATPYELTNTLEIGFQAFSAFLTTFQVVIIGNAVNPNLTYMYYPIIPLVEDQTGQQGNNNNPTPAQGSGTPSSPILLSLMGSYTVAPGTAVEFIEFGNILSTPMNTSFNESSTDQEDSFLDGDNSSDDNSLFSDNDYYGNSSLTAVQQKPVQTHAVAILDQLEKTLAGQDSSSWHDGVQWVDAAGIAMTAAQITVTKKKSVLTRIARFLGF